MYKTLWRPQGELKLKSWDWKGFEVKYGVLEKFVWVLQKSCKIPWNVFLKKGKNPVITLQYGEEGTKFKVISKLASTYCKIICKDQCINVMMIMVENY